MAIVDYNKWTNLGTEGPSVVSTSRSYSDLNLNFIKNGNTNDINPLRDIDAVKQAVKNLRQKLDHFCTLNHRDVSDGTRKLLRRRRRMGGGGRARQ